MNLSMMLAALALVPQPQKTVEQGGSTERTDVTSVLVPLTGV